MKTVLYARVSTAEQMIEHQEAQARAAGFAIDETVADHGVSGLSTKLSERPQGRRLFDMLRKGDVLVVRWLDRLGRNYDDVKDTVQALMKRGVIVRTVINGMAFDGTITDPMQRAVQDALLVFMSALGQAQAEATKEAQRAGIAHARAAEGQTAYRGRKPSFTRTELAAVDAMLSVGKNVSEIAAETGLSRQTVYRIKDRRAEAEAALAKWDAKAA
jgi:putative DNA-invertase from lambdoid prophage Rac